MTAVRCGLDMVASVCWYVATLFRNPPSKCKGQWGGSMDQAILQSGPRPCHDTLTENIRRTTGTDGKVRTDASGGRGQIQPLAHARGPWRRAIAAARSHARRSLVLSLQYLARAVPANRPVPGWLYPNRTGPVLCAQRSWAVQHGRECLEMDVANDLGAVAEKSTQAAHAGKAGFKLGKDGSYSCHTSCCFRDSITARSGTSPHSSTLHHGFRLLHAP